MPIWDIVLIYLTRILICFAQPISHDGYRIHMEPPPQRCLPPLPQGLSLGTINIRDSQVPGIAQDIWAVQIGSFNLIIMTDTKITDHTYCHNRLGYNVVCLLVITTAAGGVQGGVGLVVRD